MKQKNEEASSIKGILKIARLKSKNDKENYLCSYFG